MYSFSKRVIHLTRFRGIESSQKVKIQGYSGCTDIRFDIGQEFTLKNEGKKDPLCDPCFKRNYLVGLERVFFLLGNNKSINWQ